MVVIVSGKNGEAGGMIIGRKKVFFSPARCVTAKVDDQRGRR